MTLTYYTPFFGLLFLLSVIIHTEPLIVNGKDINEISKPGYEVTCSVAADTPNIIFSMQGNEVLLSSFKFNEEQLNQLDNEYNSLKNTTQYSKSKNIHMASEQDFNTNGMFFEASEKITFQTKRQMLINYSILQSKKIRLDGQNFEVRFFIIEPGVLLIIPSIEHSLIKYIHVTFKENVNLPYYIESIFDFNNLENSNYLICFGASKIAIGFTEQAYV